MRSKDRTSPPLIRHRRPRGTGATPAGYERQPFPVADFDQGRDLFRPLYQDHRLGQGLAAAVVVAIGPAIRRVQQQSARSGDGPQVGDYLRA